MTNTPHLPDDDQIRAIAARLDRPLVLIGMMGVGKSTIGRKLGHLLDLPFIDADEAIEEAAQMTISEVFERFGEAHFRDGERRVIARMLDDGPCVIATGGGAFMQAETRELILTKGIAAWLDSDVATLVERVGRKDTRPLLRNGDPHEILTRLKAERDGAYALAPLHITSHTGPHTDTINQILKALDQWL